MLAAWICPTGAEIGKKPSVDIEPWDRSLGTPIPLFRLLTSKVAERGFTVVSPFPHKGSSSSRPVDYFDYGGFQSRAPFPLSVQHETQVVIANAKVTGRLAHATALAEQCNSKLDSAGRHDLKGRLDRLTRQALKSDAYCGRF